MKKAHLFPECYSFFMLFILAFYKSLLSLFFPSFYGSPFHYFYVVEDLLFILFQLFAVICTIFSHLITSSTLLPVLLLVVINTINFVGLLFQLHSTTSQPLVISLLTGYHYVWEEFRAGAPSTNELDGRLEYYEYYIEAWLRVNRLFFLYY